MIAGTESVLASFGRAGDKTLQIGKRWNVSPPIMREFTNSTIYTATIYMAVVLTSKHRIDVVRSLYMRTKLNLSASKESLI